MKMIEFGENLYFHITNRYILNYLYMLIGNYINS